MAARGVGSVLMVCLVLGLLLGQSTASFERCYNDCFLWCAQKPLTSPSYCAAKCLGKCLSHTSPPGNLKETDYFCKLGCASSRCTSLSSKQDAGEAKVESCVNSCSETCATNI